MSYSATGSEEGCGVTVFRGPDTMYLLGRVTEHEGEKEAAAGEPDDRGSLASLNGDL